MFPVLQVGPVAVQVPGLLILAGVWVGITLVERECSKRHVPAGLVSNLIFLAMVGGVIGARLGYVARYFDIYLQTPLSVLSLNPNALSISDGFLSAGVVALIYGQRKGLPFWPTLDALTPGFAALAVAVAAAHLASGDAFGAPTQAFWGIDLWGARRQPTQVFEMVLAGAWLVVVLRMKNQLPFHGFEVLSWLALSAAARLFLEAFRGDSVIVLGGVREAQLISLVVLWAALLGLHLRAKGSIGSSASD